MLLPISKINYNHPIYIRNKSQNSNGAAPAFFDNFKSIYDNKISFTHYMGFKDSSVTKKPDYYKLAQLELSDGTLHQFTPDKSQIECAEKLLQGNSVLYCAPTGTGKTAVIHFAVNKNLDENKKTLITVPLVALANDKYREFSKIYGIDNVGIMTGDRKLNPNAPIVIMTTEILYNQSDDLKKNSDKIGTVVFDEAHYMSDVERGSVWEKSIMDSVPNDIQVLCLSATVGNADTLNNWISSLNTDKISSCVELKPKERYVPLVWQIYSPLSKEKFVPVIQYSVDIENLSSDNINDKQRRGISRIFQIQNNKNEFYELSENEANNVIDSLKTSLRPWYQSTDDFEEDFENTYQGFSKDEIREIANLLRNDDDKYIKHVYIQSQPHDDFKKLIDDLRLQDKLPALIFKLSRRECDDINDNLLKQQVDLTTDDEKEEIKQIIEKYQQNGYLGKNINKDALIQGIGVHHAGKLPEYRKLVEELFSKKLLKVVIATSTLSAGINMPARSVILSGMTYKSYNPHTQEMQSSTLTVNEFHQMAGRAGRRGIDNIGNVILYNLKAVPNKFKKEEHNKEVLNELELAYQYIGAGADNIRSQFRPDPVLVSRYYNGTDETLSEIIDKSFGIFSAKDKDAKRQSKLKQFENYSHILLKQGFLYRDYKNNYVLTPKGKLLLNAQGANPLMMVNLIYDGLLDNVTPVTLSQIAGYIAGSDDIKEAEGVDEAVDCILEEKIKSKQEIKQFKKIRQMYFEKEARLLRVLNESKVQPYDIISGDNISGLILYLWAALNSENPDSIENFETISSINYKTDNKDIKNTFKAKLSEGSIYRNISHTISVLKRIERICDYALSDSENYPNSEYYADLKDKAIEAVDLIERKPISAEDIE